MPALIRYLDILRAGLPPLIALLLLVWAQATAVAVPAGPRLATIEMIDSDAAGKREEDQVPSLALALIDPATGKERRFLRGSMIAQGRIIPAPFGAPSWSADGARIAFHSFDERSERGGISLVADDGTGVRPVPNTVNGTDPVLSPDGRMLAFTRTRSGNRVPRDILRNPQKVRSYSSTSTWVIDLSGGKPRRLTRWRDGLHHEPTSFAPDGSALLLDKRDANLPGPRIVRLDLADGATRELVVGAEEGQYSPDGTRIAFVGYLHPDWVEAYEDRYPAAELYIARADGTEAKRLSRSDDVLESSPSWDPSGQRLAYVQFRADTSFAPGLGLLFPVGNALMQVNADGTCREKIVSNPKVAYYGAAWQPGPGREAGPISC